MADFAQIVIVGAGQAGARAALAARECNPDVAITLLGDEPHHPYERPELSKSMLCASESPPPYILDADQFAAQRITLKTGCTVTEIDRPGRRAILQDGAAVPYDRLLLATGGRLRRLTIEGIDPEKICYLRTLDECRLLEQQLRMQPSVAVIGGGFIGLEIAAAARKLGCDVTVVEAADRLLNRMGSREASDIIADHHRASGTDIRLGAGVLRGGDGVLHLMDGSQIPAALIVAGIGVTPATGLAEAAGLEVDDGLLVDGYGRTSDPDIFGAGDAARRMPEGSKRGARLESWHNANEQANAAGRSMAGCPTQSTAVPWVWSDQGSLNLQIVGGPEYADEMVQRGDPRDGDGVSLFYLREDRLIGAIAIDRGGDVAMMRRLVAQGDLALPLASLADNKQPLRKFARSRRAA